MFSGEECPSAASPWDTPWGSPLSNRTSRSFAPGHVDVLERVHPAQEVRDLLVLRRIELELRNGHSVEFRTGVEAHGFVERKRDVVVKEGGVSAASSKDGVLNARLP